MNMGIAIPPDVLQPIWCLASVPALAVFEPAGSDTPSHYGHCTLPVHPGVTGSLQLLATQLVITQPLAFPAIVTSPLLRIPADQPG